MNHLGPGVASPPTWLKQCGLAAVPLPRPSQHNCAVPFKCPGQQAFKMLFDFFDKLLKGLTTMFNDLLSYFLLIFTP